MEELQAKSQTIYIPVFALQLTEQPILEQSALFQVTPT